MLDIRIHKQVLYKWTFVFQEVLVYDEESGEYQKYLYIADGEDEDDGPAQDLNGLDQVGIVFYCIHFILNVDWIFTFLFIIFK